MNRFWEWMEKKEYGYSDDTGDYLLNEEYIEEFPYQMLIGYMIEYIREKGKSSCHLINICLENLYELLEEIIEEIE